MEPRTWIALLLLTSLTAVPFVTADTETASPAEITLRVAPEGFVVPSHYLAANPSVWLIDPVETTTFNDQDGVAGCVLEVSETDDPDTRVDGVEVLDRATETGCISGWDSERTDLGRVLTSVDGREKVGPTQTGWPGAWWTIQKNGVSAGSGIDAMDLADGDAISFVYYTGP